MAPYSNSFYKALLLDSRVFCQTFPNGTCYLFFLFDMVARSYLPSEKTKAFPPQRFVLLSLDLGTTIFSPLLHQDPFRSSYLKSMATPGDPPFPFLGFFLQGGPLLLDGYLNPLPLPGLFFRTSATNPHFHSK